MGRKTERLFQVTEEDLKNINKDNLELVEDFINYLETTDHSPKTIDVYKSNLNIFFSYMLHNLKNKDFSEIKKRDILNFQNYCVKNGLSSSRIRALRSAISSLSNFIESVLDEEEKWEGFRNIISKIPAPTQNYVREKTIISDEELEYLLNELVNRGKIQIAAYVALSAFSGARKSEMILYKRSFFTEENIRNGLYVTPEIRTKGKGVAGKKLKKYLIKSKADKYIQLLDIEREKLGIDIDELFVTKSNDKWKVINVGTVDYWLQECTEILGKPNYSHSYRHFFVSYLVRENLPIDVVKDICGHTSSATTSLYNDNPKEDGFLKYFNEEGIVNIEEKSLSDL